MYYLEKETCKQLNQVIIVIIGLVPTGDCDAPPSIKMESASMTKGVWDAARGKRYVNNISVQ